MKVKAVVLVAVLAGPSGAWGGEAGRTAINPALIYGRAFLMAPGWPQADSDFLLTNRWQGHKLPPRFDELIRGYDDQFALVCQGARSTAPCDWGLDLSAGPATLLPHLARAKAVVVAARLRVQWHLEHGRQAEACEEWLAALALSRNVGRDGILISALVQMAGESISCSTVAANFGRFSPESLQKLAAGLESAPARSTVAGSLPAERTLCLDWVLGRIRELQRQHPGDEGGIMRQLQPLLDFKDPQGGETSNWTRLTNAARGTSEGMIGLLQEAARAGDRAAPFLALPYAEYSSQVKSYRDELAKSPNPLLSETLRSVVVARQKELRVLAYLGMVRAALEYKLRGEAGLRSVNDPCGAGPFAFRRFVFEGVDRGFELKSGFDLGNDKAVLIFVEKDGPPFVVDGNRPGEALPKAAPRP